MAAGSCSTRACIGAIDEPQIEPDRRRAAIRPLERQGQRLEQPREHERQRLQRRRSATRARCVRRKRGTSGIGHERPRSSRAPAAAARCPPAQPCGERRGRQRRHLAERREPPAVEDLERLSIALIRTGCRGRDRSRDADRRGSALACCMAAPTSAHTCRSTSSRTGASADATSSVTTVSPGNADDSSTAPACVGATATPRDPRHVSDQRCRRIDGDPPPIACGSPSRRPSPLTSSTTQSLP